MLAEIIDRSLQTGGSVPEQSEAAIAGRAQKSPYQLCSMVMVDLESATPVLRVLRVTDSTAAILRHKPSVVFRWSDSVLSQRLDSTALSYGYPIFSVITLLVFLCFFWIRGITLAVFLSQFLASMSTIAVLVFLLFISWYFLSLQSTTVSAIAVEFVFPPTVLCERGQRKQQLAVSAYFHRNNDTSPLREFVGFPRMCATA